jgi:shikimate kinase
LNRHLYLVGYRGTGKTTVGRLVAAALGRPFVDLDEQIEATAGTSIAGIFASEGESGFRDRETAALRTGSVSDGPPSIIATGGGIVLREENREILKATGFAVWLQASAEAIWERIQADTATAARRPNLTVAGGLSEIVELLAVRQRFYEGVSDARVPTDGRSPEAVAASILSLYRSASPD